MRSTTGGLRQRGPLGEPIREPVVEYANWAVKRPEAKVAVEPVGIATVGGFVYRGRAIPELYGRIVFGDFSTVLERPSGQVFVAAPAESWGALSPVAPLHRLDQRLHTLGEDAAGELYLLTPPGHSGRPERQALEAGARQGRLTRAWRGAAVAPIAPAAV